MSTFPNHVGNKVVFKPPKNVPDGKQRTGRIVDELWADNQGLKSRHQQGHAANCWGEYAFCAQLIEWDNGGHSIRFAYYRQSCGSEKWTFGSQTTVEANPEDIKSLCEKTLAKGEWLAKKPPTFSN